MTIKDAILKIEDPNATPGELTALNMWLAAQYGTKCLEFGDLINKKNVGWLALRAKFESDKQADKAWDATLDGQAETTLRMELKMMEKLMTAIKTHLRVKENEARNQY